MFRRPGSPKLERAVLRLADGHRIDVRFRDAPVSYQRMHDIVDEAWSRQEELVAQGSGFSFASQSPRGFVRIHVHGDVAAGRRVLQHLDALPYVVVAWGPSARSM